MPTLEKTSKRIFCIGTINLVVLSLFIYVVLNENKTKKMFSDIPIPFGEEHVTGHVSINYYIISLLKAKIN